MSTMTPEKSSATRGRRRITLRGRGRRRATYADLIGEKAALEYMAEKKSADRAAARKAVASGRR